MDRNWKSYLDEHFPNIAGMYISASQMKRVNRQLEKRNDNLLLEIKPHEATFYDQLIRVVEPGIGDERERKVAVEYLQFLDEQIAEFASLVNNEKQLMDKLKHELEKLFMVNGFKYLDQIGQLASTVFLIKNLDNYNLKELAYKFERVKPKGEWDRDADLLFVENTTNQQLLVDVVSVHSDYKKIENEAGLLKFIMGRLDPKRKSKETVPSASDDNTQQIYLQPFTWIHDIDTILKYKQFFTDLQIEFTLPILCCRQRSDNQGNLYYNCVEIAKIDSRPTF